MINRDSRGHSYFIVRGEILGFMKDEQLRKKKSTTRTTPPDVNLGVGSTYYAS
ncbi:hypothetical protein YC2023_071598 [Brassica napus]